MNNFWGHFAHVQSESFKTAQSFLQMNCYKIDAPYYCIDFVISVLYKIVVHLNFIIEFKCKSHINQFKSPAPLKNQWKFLILNLHISSTEKLWNVGWKQLRHQMKAPERWIIVVFANNYKVPEGRRGLSAEHCGMRSYCITL